MLNVERGTMNVESLSVRVERETLKVEGLCRADCLFINVIIRMG